MGHSIRSNCAFRKEEFGGLLFIKDKNVFIELNKSAYSILNLIEKGAEEEEISKSLKISKSKLQTFLNNLKRLGCLE